MVFCMFAVFFFKKEILVEISFLKKKHERMQNTIKERVNHWRKPLENHWKTTGEQSKPLGTCVRHALQLSALVGLFWCGPLSDGISQFVSVRRR